MASLFARSHQARISTWKRSQIPRSIFARVLWARWCPARISRPPRGLQRQTICAGQPVTASPEKDGLPHVAECCHAAQPDRNGVRERSLRTRRRFSERGTSSSSYRRTVVLRGVVSSPTSRSFPRAEVPLNHSPLIVAHLVEMGGRRQATSSGKSEHAYGTHHLLCRSSEGGDETWKVNRSSARSIGRFDNKDMFDRHV
jgi:hypothetical protein